MVLCARSLVRALSDDVKYKHQRNQIFLSASRRQAYQFRSFIRSAAAEVDVELKGGDMIQLFNGAELHFLGTSAATAQSYTGNLYFDEFLGRPVCQPEESSRCDGDVKRADAYLFLHPVSRKP